MRFYRYNRYLLKSQRDDPFIEIPIEKLNKPLRAGRHTPTNNSRKKNARLTKTRLFVGAQFIALLFGHLARSIYGTLHGVAPLGLWRGVGKHGFYKHAAPLGLRLFHI